MPETKELLTSQTLANLTAELKATFAKKTLVQAMEGKVDTLIGRDTGKSVRTIANEELAAQLIPSNAKDALDTLQEIAAWIQSHPDDASAMNAAITALQDKLVLGTYENNGEQAEYSTVQAYVEAMVAQLDARATKVEASTTNGNIKINDVETIVYELPSTVLHDADIRDYTRAEIAAMLADDTVSDGESGSDSGDTVSDGESGNEPGQEGGN